MESASATHCSSVSVTHELKARQQRRKTEPIRAHSNISLLPYSMHQNKLHMRNNADSWFTGAPFRLPQGWWVRNAGGFIVDDDGAGYMDIGEEDDWTVEEQQPESAHPAKKQKADDGKKGMAHLVMMRQFQTDLWQPRLVVKPIAQAAAFGPQQPPRPACCQTTLHEFACVALCH